MTPPRAPTFDAAAFEAALSARATEAEATLDRLLPRPGDGAEARLYAAMRYAALGGGKRLRAFLALETATLCGAPVEAGRRAAAAVEAVHAYSLVHDDLPAMDDDALRRGRPTAHIAFDEATAILAGDALQTAAFEWLASPQTGVSAERRIAVVAALSVAAGASGMVAGQAIDLAAEAAAASGGAFDLAETARLQRLKTGALIRFAAASGALLAGADPDPLTQYAEALGLAFQIRDDLLDHEGDEAAAGKRLRKDADAGKATYVGRLGVDGAKAEAARLAVDAQDALAAYGASADRLRDAAAFAAQRKS